MKAVNARIFRILTKTHSLPAEKAITEKVIEVFAIFVEAPSCRQPDCMMALQNKSARKVERFFLKSSKIALQM